MKKAFSILLIGVFMVGICSTAYASLWDDLITGLGTAFGAAMGGLWEKDKDDEGGGGVADAAKDAVKTKTFKLVPRYNITVVCTPKGSYAVGLYDANNKIIANKMTSGGGFAFMGSDSNTVTFDKVWGHRNYKVAAAKATKGPNGLTLIQPPSMGTRIWYLQKNEYVSYDFRGNKQQVTTIGNPAQVMPKAKVNPPLNENINR